MSASVISPVLMKNYGGVIVPAYINKNKKGLLQRSVPSPFQARFRIHYHCLLSCRSDSRRHILTHRRRISTRRCCSSPCRSDKSRPTTTGSQRDTARSTPRCRAHWPPPAWTESPKEKECTGFGVRLHRGKPRGKKTLDEFR